MHFETLYRFPLGPTGGSIVFPEAWAQGRATFGGLVSAAGLYALRQEVQEPVLSACSRYLAPVVPGIETRVKTEVIKRGRAYIDARADLYQEGRLCAVIQGGFGPERPSSLTGRVATVQPPPAPAPDLTSRFLGAAGTRPRFIEHVDLVFTDGSPPFSKAGDPVIGGWVRMHGGVTGPEGLLGLLDAYPPAVLPMLDRPAPSSTVHWTAYLLGEPSTDPDAWYRLLVRAETGGHGWSTSRGHLWNEEGALLGWMDQLVAVFG